MIKSDLIMAISMLPPLSKCEISKMCQLSTLTLPNFMKEKRDEALQKKRLVPSAVEDDKDDKTQVI